MLFLIFGVKVPAGSLPSVSALDVADLSMCLMIQRRFKGTQSLKHPEGGSHDAQGFPDGILTSLDTKANPTCFSFVNLTLNGKT